MLIKTKSFLFLTGAILLIAPVFFADRQDSGSPKDSHPTLVTPPGSLPELFGDPDGLVLSAHPADWREMPESHRKPAARVHLIAQITGQGGIDDDTFARHLSKAMRTWSATTGLEACVNFCRRPDNSRYSGIVSTSRSQVQCALANVCPSGYVPTTLTAHTHPPGHVVAPNAADRVLVPLWVLLTNPVLLVAPELVSPADKKLGMGYVITPKKILKFSARPPASVRVDEALPPVSVLPPGTRAAPVLDIPPPELEVILAPPAV